MTHSMANHWWWRPGWRPGRRFYTWHITFAGADDVHRLAAIYRQALAPVTGLDLIPDPGLHLTMQGLGFTDEVPAKDADAIVEAASAHLTSIPAFDLEIHRPQITPEAIRWEAQPSRPPADLRAAIRSAIGDVWSEVPEQADKFAPHISIAYSNADGPAAPAQAALHSVSPEPATARITAVELIVLGRDRQMYEWETHAHLPLA
ncbi:2'-5' RNA ligase family protein [Streptomyces sp. NBC_00829]|uniref:2'-5' RNA ligase family protein n=1 Tax=Streptomyces sp. NBC_00829 TaxID=2903679 RepID=UPI003863EA32|nr:2'-5' RNA ligase family protein [Streptomyces sp. NBC_00829]